MMIIIQILINQRETDLQDDDLPHMASVQQPVTTSSVGKWKERLSDKQKKILPNPCLTYSKNTDTKHECFIYHKLVSH